jgi:adenylate kinase family enzyme
VIGTTGAGKSTLAAELACRMHVPHLELDAFHWQPGWKEADREITRGRIEEFTRAQAWVCDGNYGFLRDILWKRAQALVWLDYPLPFIFWRLWSRTWIRVLKKEILWGTNTENLASQFFSRDSLFLWALKTHKRHRRDYSALPGLPEYRHLKVFRFRSARETEKWLNQF